MDPFLFSAPLIDSYFDLALCKYYNLELISAKVKKDRGMWRLDCKLKGTKENIENFQRKSPFMEYYLDEIDKLIQKGLTAPPISQE